MTDRRGACAARCTDGDVPHLTVLRKVPEQYEVANGSLKRLFVQLRFEDLHVDLRRCRGVGHDDIQVFEA